MDTSKCSILIVGAIDDNANEIEEYDPTTKHWRTFYKIPKKIKNFSSVLIEHKLYLFGGTLENEVTNKVWLLDLNTKNLKELQSMENERADSKAVICNKRIFVIGGVDSQAQPLYTIEEYDIENDIWRTSIKINFKRYDYAVAVIDSKIYIIGGYDDGASTDVDVYCTDSNELMERSPMAFKRRALTAVSRDDCIYAIGGRDDSLVLDTVEKYNPSINNWENLEKLAEPRESSCAVIYNNQIICFGNKKSDAIFEFRWHMNAWTQNGEMKNPRRYYMAFVLENGLRVGDEIRDQTASNEKASTSKVGLQMKRNDEEQGVEKNKYKIIKNMFNGGNFINKFSFDPSIFQRLTGFTEKPRKIQPNKNKYNDAGNFTRKCNGNDKYSDDDGDGDTDNKSDIGNINDDKDDEAVEEIDDGDENRSIKEKGVPQIESNGIGDISSISNFLKSFIFSPFVRLIEKPKGSVVNNDNQDNSDSDDSQDESDDDGNDVDGNDHKLICIVAIIMAVSAMKIFLLTRKTFMNDDSEIP
ncbi:kelch-like protein 38 [Arctopsyche grandis]|uniref:kelch-like protein 38 n=1 Tax=Arctopsyche grandis TaxID=121162 RepID=UPI00406D79CB